MRINPRRESDLDGVFAEYATAQGFRSTAPGDFDLAVNSVDEEWTDVEYPQPGVDR